MTTRNYYIQLRILHIEDDSLVRSRVRRLFERVSYADVHLTSVPTLTDGLAFLHDKTWDCILLDLTLPDSVGMPTFHHVHALSEVPIVVFTAEPELDRRVEVVAAGAQDCLYKSEVIEPDTLLRSVRFAVERHRTIVELRHALRELESANEAMRKILDSNSEDTPAKDGDDDDDDEEENDNENTTH